MVLENKFNMNVKLIKIKSNKYTWISCDNAWILCNMQEEEENKENGLDAP